jgi:bifunctional non-homologous end joining protein LigD
MTLDKYNQKRDFKKTSEPAGKKSPSSKALRFVVQKHDATSLHYDLRLEMDRVMKSWAVPKGPSMDPSEKHLAMQVEDHPISYNIFEGRIPEGQYGAGEVIVWDRGTYRSLKTASAKESEKEMLAGLKEGKLKFILKGKKLKGAFALFRFRGRENPKQWLLVKDRDEFASTEEVTADPRSVLSKKMLIGRKEDTEKYQRKIRKIKSK